MEETKTVKDSTDKETKMEMVLTGKETKAKTDHAEKERKNDPSEETETRPKELVSLVSLLQSSISSSEERLSSLEETLLSVRALAENVRVQGTAGDTVGAIVLISQFYFVITKIE